MKKYFLTLIFAFLFIFIFSIAAYGANSNLVWIIEPELEYDYIYYCASCNLFGSDPYSNINIAPLERDSNLLNIPIHLPKFYSDGSAYVSVGHGVMTTWYFYDDEKDVFVVFRRSENGSDINYYTADNFINYGLIAIKKIDSENVGFENFEGWLGLDGTYVGDKYALMYGNKFITDFIFEDFKSRGVRYFPKDFIDIKYNGKYGVINKNGNVAISFIFEDIEFINDDAAFAKYNGKYGVLDLKKTMFVSSPATGRSVLYYIFLFALLILFFRLKFPSSLNSRTRNMRS